jgi:cell division septum initiation protein DivIVA
MADQNPITLIEGRSLPVAVRGYDRKATDKLFDEVKATLTAIISERDSAQARVGELESRAAAVEQREKEVTEALLVASRVRGESEREGKELKAKFEQDAEAIATASKQQAEERLRAAEAEAERIVAQARTRMRTFEQDARNAEQLSIRAREQLATFLESLLAKVEQRGADLGSVVHDLVKRAGETARGDGSHVEPLVSRPLTPESPAPTLPHQ